MTRTFQIDSLLKKIILLKESNLKMNQN